MTWCLVGSEMCIRDRQCAQYLSRWPLGDPATGPKIRCPVRDITEPSNTLHSATQVIKVDLERSHIMASFGQKFSHFSVPPKSRSLRLPPASAFKRRITGVMCLIAIAAFPPGVSANLEEVVVTARKKVESLQDTPISVTALSGDRLENMGLSRITKLQNVTPCLLYTSDAADEV